MFLGRPRVFVSATGMTRVFLAVVACPSVPDVDHGTLDVISSTYGSDAQLQCDVGYVIDGDSLRTAPFTCSSSGVWISADGHELTCHGTVTPSIHNTYIIPP